MKKLEDMKYLRTEIEDMLRDEDLPDGFQGWMGKLAGQIIRIAGLLQHNGTYKW